MDGSGWKNVVSVLGKERGVTHRRRSVTSCLLVVSTDKSRLPSLRRDFGTMSTKDTESRSNVELLSAVTDKLDSVYSGPCPHTIPLQGRIGPTLRPRWRMVETSLEPCKVVKRDDGSSRDHDDEQ